MPSDFNIPISRRHHLGLCGTALAGLFLARDVFAEPSRHDFAESSAKPEIPAGLRCVGRADAPALSRSAA